MEEDTVMRVEGDVLKGKMTVKEALVGREKVKGAAAKERYENVRDYDPVLKSHCRIPR